MRAVCTPAAARNWAPATRRLCPLYFSMMRPVVSVTDVATPACWRVWRSDFVKTYFVRASPSGEGNRGRYVFPPRCRCPANRMRWRSPACHGHIVVAPECHMHISESEPSKNHGCSSCGPAPWVRSRNPWCSSDLLWRRKSPARVAWTSCRGSWGLPCVQFCWCRTCRHPYCRPHWPKQTNRTQPSAGQGLILFALIWPRHGSWTSRTAREQLHALEVDGPLLTESTKLLICILLLSSKPPHNECIPGSVGRPAPPKQSKWPWRFSIEIRGLAW